MHESTRRLICRAILVAGCVVPTLLVSFWIAWRMLPGEAERWAAVLSSETGLAVSVGTAENPKPGRLILRNVEVHDPETGHLLLHARLVEAAWRDGGIGLLAAQPEIAPGGLARLWQAFHDRRVQSPATIDLPIDITAGELTLRDADPVRSLTVNELSARLDQGPSGPRAVAEFRVAGLTLSTPLVLEVGRRRDKGPPTTYLRFDTSGNAVPVALLAQRYPPLAELGREATFRGSIWATLGDEPASAEIAAEITRLDLAQLVGQRFARQVSGTATLSGFEAELRGGRLVRASGMLRGGPGWIERQLVVTADETLGLAPAAWAAETQERMLHYRQLALHFVLDGRGLTVTGKCPDQPPGVALVDSRGELLKQAQTEATPRPAVALARWLATSNAIEVPATSETDGLMRWLPLPPRTASRPGAGQPPAGRLLPGDIDPLP